MTPPSSRRARLGVLVGLLVVATAYAAGQPSADLPAPLQDMVETERRFAARAVEVGWKDAFLEFFYDGAVGFAEGSVGLAKSQIRARPDPPKDFQLLWEPRWGDVSASGELGFLTGPSRTIQPGTNGGRPSHAVYASVWRRQRDGSYQVVLDAVVPVPSAAPFAPGFVRAARDSRFSGDYDERTPPLAAADGVLNSDLRTGQMRAYRNRLTPGARLHRPGVLPVVGESRVLPYLKTQPAMTAADTRFSESSQTGDLGYTWGTYVVPRRAPNRGTTRGRGAMIREEGFYVRVWMRERDGQWKVAVDVLQPQ